jgi:hypothetical protein
MAFKMWQHCNTWQHDKYNPKNCCQHLELDHQIESAFRQDTVWVLNKHLHLFLIPLADQQQLPLLLVWLEFVQLTQWQARAHLRRQQDSATLPGIQRLRHLLLDPRNVNGPTLGQPHHACYIVLQISGLLWVQFMTPRFRLRLE